MLREILLLEAFGKATFADMQFKLLELETQFAALLDPTTASDVLRRRMARGRWLGRVQMFDMYAKEPSMLTAESMVHLYSALERSGILKDEIDSDRASGDDES